MKSRPRRYSARKIWGAGSPISRPPPLSAIRTRDVPGMGAMLSRSVPGHWRSPASTGTVSVRGTASVSGKYTRLTRARSLPPFASWTASRSPSPTKPRPLISGEPGASELGRCSGTGGSADEHAESKTAASQPMTKAPAAEIHWRTNAPARSFVEDEGDGNRLVPPKPVAVSSVAEFGCSETSR